MVDEIMKTYEDTEITKDPFISPALSPDDLLRGLPPVNLIVSNYIYILLLILKYNSL